ncbi:hypothetical protein FRC01_003452 [Tulasnella sp. 417]|nr:hypothetical protein FRC01_003452 [Tulasnella sp. 417]
MEPTTESAIASTATEDERRHHNNQLSIHQLPLELLCNVLKDGHRRGNYQALFSIRSVCKHWMELVDSTPELWTFVSLVHDENLLDMSLQRSKNRLLSIEYNNPGWPQTPQFPSGKTENFLRRVMPLAHRWKRLDYYAHAEDLAAILRLQLQNLETLNFHNPRFSADHLQPLHAPKLRHVTLEGLSLNWESLSNLRALILTKPTVDPSVGQVYVLFTNCPRLEVFRVSGDAMAIWPRDYKNIDLPNAPLFLPHLQYFLLFEVQVAPYSRLLSLIDAPNLRRLYCFRHFNPYDPNRKPMFEPVARFFGSYAHSLNNDRDHARLRISSSDRSFTISVGACKVVLYYRLPWDLDGFGCDCMPELSAALSRFDERVSGNIKTIHFGGTRPMKDLITLGPIFQRHFPNIEELVVTLSSPKSATLFLKVLASPFAFEDGVRWLFPRLTSLRLNARRDPVCDRVLGVIEARQNGQVRAIQRVRIKNGSIRRDTAAKLEASLQDFRMAGTRCVDTVAEGG